MRARLTVPRRSATVLSMLPGRQPLRALKDETLELHARAEHYVRILDRDATVEDYARYLVAMLGFHAPIEALLAGDRELSAAGFQANLRRKAHLIAHDLRAVAPSGIATPRCSALPISATAAQRIGIAYVIEGSTLGGKFVVSRLPPALVGLRGAATAFLDGYGTATGERWRAFGGVVDRVVTSPEAERDAITGARATFERLIDWLARFERPDARRAMRAAPAAPRPAIAEAS